MMKIEVIIDGDVTKADKNTVPLAISFGKTEDETTTDTERTVAMMLMDVLRAEFRPRLTKELDEAMKEVKRLKKKAPAKKKAKAKK